ncbi:hypothetical protein Barb6_01967 [Bacteroidales bacterium Barb6]|nr:hypothetical protein Barb6_01967 [Bacteroidales bacterium Barb6]
MKEKVGNGLEVEIIYYQIEMDNSQNVEDNNKAFLKELEKNINKGYKYIDFWLRGLLDNYIKMRSLEKEHYKDWINNTRFIAGSNYPQIIKWCDDYEKGIEKEIKRKIDEIKKKQELSPQEHSTYHWDDDVKKLMNNQK